MLRAADQISKAARKNENNRTHSYFLVHPSRLSGSLQGLPEQEMAVRGYKNSFPYLESNHDLPGHDEQF